MATITKRSSGSYQVHIRRKGSPVLTKSFKRLSDAKQWVTQQEALILEGRSSLSLGKQRLSVLIGEYAKVHLVRKAVGPAQAGQLSRWCSLLGDPELRHLTPQAVHKAKLGLGVSGATLNRYLAALSHCCKFGVQELQWMSTNPVSAVSKDKEPKGRTRTLSPDERKRLLTQTERFPMLHGLVVTALTTGLRATELTQMHWDLPEVAPPNAWSVVDLSRGLITVHDSKNGSKRVLPLVRADVLPKKNGSGLVFSHDGVRPVAYRHHWELCLEEAGITQFRWHDLRHCFASDLARSGFSIPEIASALGHKSFQMASRYAHFQENSLTQKILDAVR